MQRAAVLIDHALAVFLDELAALRREHVEHLFGWPAEPHPFRADDDRPVDEDRMRQHGVDKLVVGQAGIVKAKLRIGRALLAQ
jgi:hypothetical protein